MTPRREANRLHDKHRGSARERGYDSRWERARLAFLRAHPLCIMCEREGRITPATVVDHITPHKGDADLFWTQANWQPLCKPHHDGAKQREERSGKAHGVDADGRPLDPDHPWNRGR